MHDPLVLRHTASLLEHILIMRMFAVDFGRAFRVSSIGAVELGWLIPTYYTMIQGKLPGRDIKSVAMKVLLDVSVDVFCTLL